VWSTKAFDELLKENNSDTGKIPSLSIGYTKPKGKGSPISTQDKPFVINCVEDYKTATFKQLEELGQRGLSSSEPSLGKLKQPVAEDPQNSLHKRERGYLNPSQISYGQASYR
jgi:hypothetical protein